MESVEFLVAGCGPAGAQAAREAAAHGIQTVVLEKDAIVGTKRVCAAGLRPGFCDTFDLPRELVHCDTPRLALFDTNAREHEVFFGPGHTSTREELDGTMAQLARAQAPRFARNRCFAHSNATAIRRSSSMRICNAARASAFARATSSSRKARPRASKP